MLDFKRLPEDYVYVDFKNQDPQYAVSMLFSFSEKEGLNGVISRREAEEHKMDYTFVCSVFQLIETTALNAVGITAKVSTALAHKNIPCNAVAALHHDYFLIPKNRAEEAWELLKALG